MENVRIVELNKDDIVQFQCANHKNGKEDLDKARWYLERAFEKWED
ncbi:hypothetical protein HUN85_03105 [Staphylococcus sp. 57-74]|nr:hypothetical protein [Staphylococcus borealis]NUI84226.1 hypothetical protein [Staphylococcus borealis]